MGSDLVQACGRRSDFRRARSRGWPGRRAAARLAGVLQPWAGPDTGPSLSISVAILVAPAPSTWSRLSRPPRGRRAWNCRRRWRTVFPYGRSRLGRHGCVGARNVLSTAAQVADRNSRCLTRSPFKSPRKADPKQDRRLDYVRFFRLRDGSPGRPCLPTEPDGCALHSTRACRKTLLTRPRGGLPNQELFPRH